MPPSSPSPGLGDMSTPLHSQSRDQPPTPSTAQESMSPPLSRSAPLSSFNPDARTQKRPRADDTQVKKPARRRMACQSCRIRKVKCDNVRPTCAICRNSRTECVYIDATPTSLYVFQGFLVQPDLTRMQGGPDNPADAGAS